MALNVRTRLERGKTADRVQRDWRCVSGVDGADSSWTRAGGHRVGRTWSNSWKLESELGLIDDKWTAGWRIWLNRRASGGVSWDGSNRSEGGYNGLIG